MRPWFITLVGLMMGLCASPLGANQLSQEAPASPLLTLRHVLAQVEQGHPLLQGSQTQKMVARGKLLTALGKFEPNLVNDWELERLVKDGNTTSVGFNDTFVEMRHPWGMKGFAGFRAGIGDVEVADLGINKTKSTAVRHCFASTSWLHHESGSRRIAKIRISRQAS